MPLDTVEIIDLLHHFPDSNRLIYVNLKRKLEYHGQVLFEPVRTIFSDIVL